MIQAEVITDRRSQCRECDRPAKTFGLCKTHYAYARLAKIGPKVCGSCGKVHNATYKTCQICYLRQRAQRRQRERESMTATSNSWPAPLDLWTALRKCRTTTSLREFLAARPTTAKMPQEIWPDTDHSLACWIASCTDTNHACTCGAVFKGAK